MRNHILIALWLILILPAPAALGKMKKVKLTHSKLKAGNYQIYGSNPNPVPFWVSLSLIKLENMKPSTTLQDYYILPANSNKTPLVQIVKIERNKGNRFQYSYTYNFGDPGQAAKQNEMKEGQKEKEFLYFFPFAHGQKFHISQGYFGKATHDKKHALDFSMPIGTPVHAARGGIVIEVKEDSDKGGNAPKYAKMGNFVTVYQADGTAAYYFHFKQNGVLLKEGDHIQKGDLIGYSGNTGYSSGPHLHFQVEKLNQTRKWQTIATNFLCENQTPCHPEAGNYYYSTNPSKPEFPVILGRNLKAKDFENRRNKITINRATNLTIRSETIDHVQLLYLQNHLAESYSIHVKLTLNNYSSEKGKEFQLRLESGEEVFLTLLKQVNRKKSALFKYSLTYTKE